MLRKLFVSLFKSKEHYKIKPIEIAMEILEQRERVFVLDYVRENLSTYSAKPNGREIMSECFSAYYSKINNEFAFKFVELCKKRYGGAKNES